MMMCLAEDDVSISSCVDQSHRQIRFLLSKCHIEPAATLMTSRVQHCIVALLAEVLLLLMEAEFCCISAGGPLCA